MKELRIRRASATDAAQIAKVEARCFALPWSEEAILQDMTRNPRAMYFVADADGVIAGYVSLWKILDEGQINNVAVLPEYRRQHIAQAMIDVMLRVTEEAGVASHTLEVRAHNAAAKALYAGFGFCEEGLRKGYYEDNGEDAVIMWRYGTARQT